MIVFTSHKALLAFEMLIENIESLRLFAIIFDNNTAASDDLPRVSLLVDLTKTNPLSKLLLVSNLKTKQTKISD